MPTVGLGDGLPICVPLELGVGSGVYVAQEEVETLSLGKGKLEGDSVADSEG